MGHLKVYPPTADTNPDFKAYWAGQTAALLNHKDAKILIETLVSEMNKKTA